MAPTREFFHASLNKLTIAAGFVQSIETQLQTGTFDSASVLEKVAKVKRALSQLEHLLVEEKRIFTETEE